MTTGIAKNKKGGKNAGKKTSAGKKSSAPAFELEFAKSIVDVLPVMRSTFDIWGAGLTKQTYYDWMAGQLNHTWSRRGFRYLLARFGGKLVASCKLYTINAKSRGVDYKVAGIGAVYTQPEWRGQGYAAKMLKEVESLCRAENFDAMLLFSDLEPEFYERLGYEQFSDCNFHIWINEASIESAIMSDAGFVEEMQEYEPDVTSIECADIAFLQSHHMRYLSKQAFGVERDASYWAYKIQRNNFLTEHSKLNWPVMELMTLPYSDGGGYAIFEQGGRILRVLEVVGSEQTQEILWRHLLRTALLRRIHLVRGWEAAAPSFMRPVKYAQREGSHPMLLPLNQTTDSWLEVVPCPLLEFDHF